MFPMIKIKPGRKGACSLLVDTMLDTLDYKNDYFDEIRDLDYICGVYFKFLGINAYETLQ